MSRRVLLVALALAVLAVGAIAPGVVAQEDEDDGDELVYTGDSLNASEHLTAPRGADISPDGRHVYVVDDDQLHQFELAEPYKLSSATHESTIGLDGAGQWGIDWVPDGSKFVVSDESYGSIYIYETDNAWNITSASKKGELFTSGDSGSSLHYGLRFDGSGERLFIKGFTDMWQYDLPEPYDVENATYAGQEAYYLDGIAFDWNYEGEEMLQAGGEEILRHDLISPYEPYSREIISTTNVSDHTSQLTGIAADGDDVYVVSDDDESLYHYRIYHDDPSLSNPRPEDDAAFSGNQVDLSVDVSDGDLPNDTVTVEFYDTEEGTLLGTDSLQDAGTAKVTVTTMGSTTWNATAEDEAGRTDSTVPRTFHTPHELEIRDVSDASLVDDREVTVEFLAEDRDTVESRSTTDGVVSLEGLPDEAYLAEIQADGYFVRSHLVTSIFEQQSAYLLNDSVDAVEHRFRLDDFTGQYQPSRSTLVLQRTVERNNETRFVDVAGDSFGAANEVILTVERDVRYRLRIRNAEGLTRVLGNWRAVEAGTTVLEIGQVTWSTDSETWRWRTAFENTTTSGGPQTGHIEFEYEDPENATTQLDLVVYEHRNESNVVHGETYTGEFGVVSETIDLHGEQVETTWRVEFEATRDGETVSASRTVADDLSVTDNPFTGQWKLVVVAFVLIFLAFLFGGVFAGIGAAFVSCAAAFLWWLGWFPVGGSVILGALLVAVLWMAGGVRPGGGI